MFSFFFKSSLVVVAVEVVKKSDSLDFKKLKPFHVG